MTAAINIVLTEGPGPTSQFIEVETDDGRSVSVGTWSTGDQGYARLRITLDDLLPDPNYCPTCGVHADATEHVEGCDRSDR